MSSIVDALLNSDNPDFDLAIQKKSTSKIPNGRSRQQSSPRPQGPPSESNGHHSDVEGFADDEVVGVRGTDRNRARNPMDRAVPKVVDEVGEKVAEEFETFLDGYGNYSLYRLSSSHLIATDLWRTLCCLVHHLPALR